MGLKQIEAIHTAVQKYSVPTIKKCLQLDEEIQKKSEDLKEIIRSYFKSDSSLEHFDVIPKVFVFYIILLPIYYIFFDKFFHQLANFRLYF